MKRWLLITLTLLFIKPVSAELFTGYFYENSSCIQATTGNQELAETFFKMFQINNDYITIKCNNYYITIKDKERIINCQCPSDEYLYSLTLYEDYGIHHSINEAMPAYEQGLINQGYELIEERVINNQSIIKYANDKGFNSFIFPLNENEFKAVECTSNMYDYDCVSKIDEGIGTVMSQEFWFSFWISILSPLIIIVLIITLIALFKRQESFIPWTLQLKTYLSLIIGLAVLTYFYIIISFIPIINIIFYFIPLLVIFRKRRGIKLTKSEAPELFKLLDKLSDEIGIKTPKVTLTPDTSIGVKGFIRKELMIGMAGIRQLSSGDLYSILAHELGHLKGFDTVIGGGLMTIKLGLNQINRFLAIIGRFFIYAFLFNLAVYFYNIIYTISILFYSRLREYTADLRAGVVVGPENYIKSFKKYVVQSTIFDKEMPKIMIQLARKNRLLKNVYKVFDDLYSKASNKSKKDFEKRLIERDIKSLFSTHPSVKNRINNLKKLKNVEEVKLPKKKAVKLIKNLKEKEETLSKMLNERLFRIKIKK